MPKQVHPIERLLRTHARETGRLAIKWRLAMRLKHGRSEVREREHAFITKLDHAIDDYFRSLD